MSPAQGPALVDTGAGISAIDELVADQYGFRKVGETRVTVANGVTEKKPVYDAVLRITRYPRFSKLIKMVGLNLQTPQRIIAIIGRDVLASGSLHYEGKKRRFSLDFS